MSISLISTPTENPSGALIGYTNLLTSATVSPAATDSTEDASNALTVDTWKRWRPPASTVTAKFQLTSAADVDYIAIAAHNLVGETILIQTAVTAGGALVDVESITPTDNSAIMITFDARNIEEIALVATYSAVNEIGVVYAGELMRMPRAVYGGHSPQSLTQDTKYHSVMSESGQFLGRTITQKGTKGSFSWEFLEDDWYRSTFQPFVLAIRTLPFFITWRPDYYSNETEFVHSVSNVVPSNMGGGHRLMSVSLKLKGHGE